MRQFIFVILIFVSLAGSACTGETISSPTPQSPPPQDPPTQGPAVVGDGIEIAGWEYLAPPGIHTYPAVSTNTRDVGDNITRARLIWKEDGFDLVWGHFICSTEPVVVIHADATIEFWPGYIVGEDCEAAEVFHKLTVKLQTDIPFEEWKFKFHPPPERNWGD